MSGSSERGEQWVPPAVGEVLGLVDDDGVEALSGRQVGGELEHLLGQVVLEELGGGFGAVGLVGAFGCAPTHSEGVELADIAGLLALRPVRGDAFQIGGQAMRVAQQRHALTFFAQSAGLFDGHEGLAAARSPADLDPLKQTDGVEDDGLAFGEDVGGVLVLQGAGDDVALRQPATAQRDLQLVDAGAGQQGPARSRVSG